MAVARIVVALVVWLAPLSARAQGPVEPVRVQPIRPVQLRLDQLRHDLGVPHAVEAVLVASNPLGFSVEPVRPAGGPDEATDEAVGAAAGDPAADPAGEAVIFRLSIDAGFLDTLSDEEVTAALAHELGHVWIFTHHPFLQTEQLANTIAQRVVSRESLVGVLEKAWAHAGVTGALRVRQRHVGTGDSLEDEQAGLLPRPDAQPEH
ncbi:MAG: hypothetical protein AB7G23_09490 [Vicinamibacterales bacterium]